MKNKEPHKWSIIFYLAVMAAGGVFLALSVYRAMSA